MWQIGAAANLIVAVAYCAISLAIVRPLQREGQLRSNPLGLATAAIFFTCAVHHGSHSVHMLLPYVGLEVSEGLALRTAFTGHVVAWDIVTAAVGIYYWTLRRTYGSLMQGARLFNDMRDQQRQALRIGDDIVKQLFIAQSALSLEDRQKADKPCAPHLNRPGTWSRSSSKNGPPRRRVRRFW